MSARPKHNFLHLALPFGGIRADHVRVVMGGEGSVKSVGSLVEEFSQAGRIDSPANLERIVSMHDSRMKKMAFPFGNILVAPQNYAELARRATDRQSVGNGYPLFTIVRIKSDHTPSSKGKPRYLCETAQEISPVLVVEKDIAPAVQEMMEWGHDTFLVASRPYTKGFSDVYDATTQIFLYVAKLDQIRFISPDHWDTPLHHGYPVRNGKPALL